MILSFFKLIDFSMFGDDERVYSDEEQSLDWDDELRIEGVGVGVDEESEFIIADLDKYGFV